MCGEAKDRWLSLITRGMTTLPRSKKNQQDSVISDGDWYKSSNPEEVVGGGFCEGCDSADALGYWRA